MSLVLDHSGNLRDYDTSANRLCNIINCDFIAKKIINRCGFLFVLSTDGELYKISKSGTEFIELYKIGETKFTIDQIKFEFFVTDFAYDYMRNILYLLSDDDIIYIMSLDDNTIIKMTQYKIIRLTTLVEFNNFCVYFILCTTNLGIIMYYDTNNNFVELNIVTKTNQSKKMLSVSTFSIAENLQFFSKEIMFQYKNEHYYYNPNKLVHPLRMQLPLDIVKYFILIDGFFFEHLTYIDGENNKYVTRNSISIIKCPLLTDYDVNLLKRTTTKSSRSRFRNVADI